MRVLNLRNVADVWEGASLGLAAGAGPEQTEKLLGAFSFSLGWILSLSFKAKKDVWHGLKVCWMMSLEADSEFSLCEGLFINLVYKIWMPVSPWHCVVHLYLFKKMESHPVAPIGLYLLGSSSLPPSGSRVTETKRSVTTPGFLCLFFFFKRIN